MTEVDLDRMDSYRLLDPDDMYRRITEFPEQIEHAWNLVEQVQLPREYREVKSVVVVGMGGSAIGGSLLQSFGEGEMSVPLTVWRGYGVPGFVDRNTLVIAVSYSGGTEETVSGLHASVERGAKVIAITTGGQIAEFAREHQIPVVTFTYDAQPRAALGYLFTPLLGLIAQLGFLPSQDKAVREAIAVAGQAREQWEAGVPAERNAAKRLAGDCQGKVVVAYGAGYLAAVSRRWKTQLNENAKNWAFWEEFPELNHNAVVGYEYPADLATRMQVVMLRGSRLQDPIIRRIQVTKQLLDQYSVPYRVVDAQGDSTVAQMVSLISLGDYVSYYLALLNGVDPTTIGSIDTLKAALAGA